jgi:acetylornithine/succinyldiaminopimelate/putrescine aminotransferase
VSAVVIEPVQVEGGVRAASDDFVQALGALTEKHDALLVADEVQTGLGRSGAFLASARWPRQPDAVVLAKALGGGLLPVSAMLTRKDWFDRAYGRDFQTGESHNSTFGFNAVSAVAALATLELLTDELFAEVRRKGALFRATLERTMAGSKLFVAARGVGMMLGVELAPLDNPWLSFEHFGMPALADRPTIAPITCHRLYKRGFFAFTCGHDWRVLRLQPRYDIPDDKLEAFARALRQECDALGALV